MMFTAQQLTGGPRYSVGVKLGNWDEDVARVEVASRDYETRRAKGELLHLTKARERAFLTQPVPHAFSPDGRVHYGDTLMLATGPEGRGARYLANHIYSFVSPGAVRVTAGASADAQARNTFVLGRPDARRSTWARAPGVPRDDVLRFGDRVTLACNPSLVADADTRVQGSPLFLHSARGNNLLGTSRRGRQEVSLTPACDADAEWLVSHAGGDKLVTDGTPVLAGAPITLSHVMSAVLLAADPAQTYPTEFGPELDVHCATARGTAHVGMRHAGDLPSLPALPPNVWRVVLAAEPSAAVDTRGLIALTPATILARARGMIAAAAGTHAFRSLALAFDGLDARGSGAVPATGVRWALYDHGARLSDAEWELVCAPFAWSGKSLGGAPAPPSSAASAAGAFLDRARLQRALRSGGDEEGVRGARADAIAEAYAHLVSKVGGGKGEGVTIGALKRAYDGRADPRVGAGALTREEAKAEFARQWASHPRATDAVTLADLVTYYDAVAPALGGDEWALEALIANAWHVPGKGSWLVKRDKRVLVTFAKGSSTEAVIVRGEGIADDDTEGLLGALKSVGYGGIAHVRVLGLVEDADGGL